ncbi:hypothetical protein D3C85_1832870 [compost metagenome]
MRAAVAAFAGFVRRTKADSGFDLNQRRAIEIGLALCDRRRDGVDVVLLFHAQVLPTVGFEAHFNIFRE